MRMVEPMGHGKFLYAILERSEKGELPCTGLRQAPLELVCYRDLAAVISTIDVEQFAVADEVCLKADLVRYQQVNAALLQQHALIPLRFGFTAHDTAQVKEVLIKVYLQLHTILNRLRDRVELAVQALWNLPALLQELGQEERQANGRESAVAVGRRLFALAEARRQVIVTAIHDHLSPLADDFLDVPCRGDTMILNRSYLVNRAKEPLFDEVMQRLGEVYGSSLSFRYIGPLAPSSFANVTLTRGNFTLVDQARRTLHLGETSSCEEIKAAYHRLLQHYHPDRNPDDAQAAVHCRAVIEAYEVLQAYGESYQRFIPEPRMTELSFTPEAVEGVFVMHTG